MKLSEAMMLGSATCKMEPGEWNSCAIGAAGNAVGVAQGIGSNGWDMADGRGRLHHIADKFRGFGSKN